MGVKVLPVKVLSAPIEARGEVTGLCNLKCLHCYNASGEKLQSELTLDEWKNVVDQLVSMKVLDIMYEGGEPFMWPHMLDLLHYSAGKMRLAVSTNGTLITREVARSLKSLDITYVQVSVDGADARTHDYLRGAPGSFNKAIEGVQHLVEADVRVVLSCVLMKPNLSQIHDYVELAKQLGVKACSFIRFQPTGRGENNRHLTLTNEELRYAMEMTVLERNNTTKVRVQTVLMAFPFLMDPQFKWTERNLPLSTCVECAEGITILADGSIIPCTALRNMIAGNVRRDRLREVYEKSSVYTSLRSLNLHDSCSSCIHFKGCRGGCRCYALDTYGDIEAPDPGCWINAYNLAQTGRRSE